MHKPFYTDDFMADVMKIERLPDRLFHYTSVDTLEKILENRSLRFGRLDQMNDPEEARASDVGLASTTVFASCWSSASRESIPLWSIYGGTTKGVRLSMPTNMFLGRQRPTVLQYGGAITSVNTELRIERQPPAMSSVMRSVIGPNKVFYTDDDSFKVRPLVLRADGIAHYNPYDLGMAKGKEWAYEDEWRFKIALMSFAHEFPDDEFLNKVTMNFEEFPVLTTQVFVPLDPSALDELVVTAGPRVSDQEFDCIQTLVQRYAARAEVARSSLAMR